MFNPFNSVLEITNRCNLRCPHCASDSGLARCDEMSREELKALDAELKAAGCTKVTILGGEFLMRPDWLGICEDVKASGMELTLITNGLLANETVLKQMLALEPKVIGVSLDGATAETYKRQRGVDGFDKCLSLLNEIAASGICQASAITTFTSLNIHDFDTFANLFIDSPIVWQVQMVHKAGKRFNDTLLLSQKQYEFLIEKVTYYTEHYLKRLKLMTMDDFGYFAMDPRLRFTHQLFRGCPAGSRVVGIRSNGDVLGCLSLGDDFIEENIHNVSFTEIWTSGKYFQRFRTKREHLTGHCQKCAFAEYCKGGCTAQAISNSGGLGENFFCIRRCEEKQLIDDFFGEEE